MHASFPLALPTMMRRCERLRAALAADDGRAVVFVRRSHLLHHHMEHPGSAALVDEVADARELAMFLQAEFPAKAARGLLRVELMLACDLCHPKVEANEAGRGGALLTVHNLTRGSSASFAEHFPSKTYKDAMVERLTSLTAGTSLGSQTPGFIDDPFALEVV